jgi:hypothetical protein
MSNAMRTKGIFHSVFPAEAVAKLGAWRTLIVHIVHVYVRVEHTKDVRLAQIACARMCVCV